MRQTPLLGVLGLTVCFFGFCTESRSAVVIDWVIDQSQSNVQLNFDASVNLVTIITPQVGSAVTHVFAPGGLTSSVNWSGQSSTIGGTISTEWDSSTNLLTFLDGTHSVSANQAYSGSINGNGQGSWLGTQTIATVDGTVGSFNLQNILFNAGGTFSLNSGLSGTATGGTFGLEGGNLSAQFVEVQTSLNTVPGTSIMLLSANLPSSSLGAFLLSNAGSLSISKLGGLDRQLTHEIDTDFILTIPLSGGALTLNGNMSGQIVAFASVPEPASASLLVAALALTGFRRRARF
jgi:hypothetical protein